MFPIERVRAEIPGVQRSIYLNTGGEGPKPKAVTDSLLAVYRRVGEGGIGPLMRNVEEVYGTQASRAKLAGFLGATPEEMALVPSVSYGISLIMEGLPLEPGDELIITSEEHPAFLVPALHLGGKRLGLTVRRLPISADPAVLLDRLESLVSPRTRLLALSHVTTDTGHRLPIDQISAYARARGIHTLFDGAQSVGQFPIDLSASGCDFYAGLGYKWLLGPYGTGFLYVRKEVEGRLGVSWTGSSAAQSIDAGTGEVVFKEGLRRFEFGAHPWALYAGLGAAVDYLSGLGLPEIEAHVQGLVDHLRARLQALPDVELLSPESRDARTGIVTFALAGVDGRKLAEGLRESDVFCRAAVGGRAVRFCVACFHTTEELDRAVEIAAGLSSALRA